MKILNYLTLVLMLGFVACDKDDDPIDSIAQTIEIDATDLKSWAYFSFDKGEVVTKSEVSNEADYKTSLDWDIALHRMDIKLNGGASGIGKAAVALIKENGNPTLFEEITESPETEFSVDIVSDIMIGYGAMMSGGDPDYAKSSKSETLGKWIEMVKGASGPTYEVKNQIFIVKTAKGKYVKLWLKSYHNAEGKGGHITIQYKYQANGSRFF